MHYPSAQSKILETPKTKITQRVLNFVLYILDNVQIFPLFNTINQRIAKDIGV